MSVKEIIFKSLKSKHTEQVVKQQMITLAEENLHKDGMADALAAVLTLQDDTRIKKRILDLVLTINTSRLIKPESFYKSLISVLQTEKEEEIRTDILNKLANSINHNKHIIPSFLQLLSGEALKDIELEIVLYAISEMPVVTPKTATIVLQKAVKRTIHIQTLALNITENCPHWNNDIKQALQPYLTPTSDKNIRTRIIDRLQEAKLLDESFIPFLINIAATDQDKDVRWNTLDTLLKFKPLQSGIIIQLITSSITDASETIRQKALKLQKNVAQLNTEAILKLLAHLKIESKSEVRIQILKLLNNYLKQPEVREALLSTYTAHSEAMESEELNTYLKLLEPYMTRNKQITTTLLKDLSDLPKINNRKTILKSLLEHSRITDILDKILVIFETETNDKLRKEIFLKFKQLSLAKYPKLVSLFCRELQEPSSLFRLECATALEPNILQFKQITPAFEDVLLHDQDKELIRICLNGYFKAGINQKFEPLLTVIENELFDLSSRQKAIEILKSMELSDKEQKMLATNFERIKETL